MGKQILPTNGEKARHARLTLALTQQQLSEKSGVSVRKIGQIEGGHGAAPWCLTAVATALGMSFQDLVAGPDSPEVADLISHSSLDGAFKARFAEGPENEALARLLFRAIAMQLNAWPTLMEFKWCRPTNSLLIGIQATVDVLYRFVHGFADGNLTNISAGFSGVPPLHARISRLYFPRTTLAWPMPFMADQTFAKAITSHFGSSLDIRFRPSGTAVLTRKRTKTSPLKV
jgi:transcriptional regulator with XRE-family HTH domain